MNAPLNSRKEVLIAELLGEIDTLLQRVESLVPRLDTASANLKRCAGEAATSLDHYRTASQTIIDQAQTSAVDHIVRRTNIVAKSTLNEQTGAMEAAARSLFDREVNPLIDSLITHLRAGRSSTRLIWLMSVATALFSAIFTVAGLYLLRG